MLIRCPECNREISDQAEQCPHCGITRITTKKVSNAKMEEEIRRLKTKYILRDCIGGLFFIILLAITGAYYILIFLMPVILVGLIIYWLVTWPKVVTKIREKYKQGNM